MNTFRALWAVVTRYWGVGDAWTRAPLFLIIAWPFVLLVVSLTGWLSITSLVALTPALVLLVLLLVSPVLTGALWAVDETRPGLKALIALVGIELLAGWYLALVPLRNDLLLIPFFVLTVVAIVLLAVGLGGRFSRAATTIGELFATALLLAFVVLTSIFLLGGREKAKERAEDAAEWVSRPAPRATAAASTAPGPNLQMVEVDSIWVTVELPMYHRQQYQPARNLEIRLLNGRILEKTPDGRLLENGEPVAGPVRIPGFSVDLRSKDRMANRVAIITQPTRITVGG